MNNQVLDKGEAFFGFQVQSVKSLPEYRATGIRLIHLATSAEVYHLHNEDKENLFSFNFRTPPEDNTGVPHIIEHSVLSGSRSFPLKDPFVTLLKGSMQTFLNAMTFPDKTVYPASSMVEKDFYNLMLVYGDAVFSPLLKEEVFKQEGHHLEFKKIEDTTSGLKLVGVVYNEMKGNYSSPESIVADWSFRSLFPDTPYGFDSGGNPEHIPELTYDDFVNFHKRYYHPSNCKVFFYGNIPTLKHLEFLQRNFFSEFSKLTINSAMSDQVRWSAPRRVEMTYPVKEANPLSKKSTITINWLTVPVTDPFKVLSLEVLSEVLVGNAGSPLRKGLIESKLGEDIAPATGLETELKELVFTVGIRGTDSQCLEKVEEVVFDTLSKLREEGEEDDFLKSAIQRVEFRNREVEGGRGTYGLKLMRKVLRGWLHDVEPETTLEFKRWMKEFRERVSREKGFLPDLIEQQLLLNPHRSTLLVRPDPDHLRMEEERSILRLKNFENRLSEKEKREVVISVIDLKKFQEKPDPPEMINKIPFLKLQDLPREVERIPCEESSLPHGVPLFFHDVFTNGIIYIDFAFDIKGVAEENSQFLPLFGKTVCGSGLPGIRYDELARMLSQYTGGFTCFLSASGEVENILGKNEYIFFRLKILSENLRNALDLIKRLIVEADFNDVERIKDLTLELKNEFKASLIPNGHQFVSLRAGSRLSDVFKVEERWKGISQVFFLDELSSGMEIELKGIVSSLKEIRRSVISRRNLIVNVTSERSLFEEAKEELANLISFLPEGDLSGVVKEPERPDEDQSKTEVESLIVTSNVGYVSRAIRGARFGTKENGYEGVLAHFLRTGYLWEKVRMRGGAYGAFAVPYGTEGVFIFSSYRDPNIVETLRAFRESLEYVKKGKIDDDQIEKAIIGTVGREEKPLDPGEKGFTSLRRKLCGITDELRQKRREVILGVNKDSLAYSAQQLLEEFDNGFTVVMSNKNAIFEASQNLKELKRCMIEVPV
ncbi:MAG: insulinase family protein [Deltaproteobacteria bacterium]|nr:insulinase family protein [Deltaproteobacteria bacterium]